MFKKINISIEIFIIFIAALFFVAALQFASNANASQTRLAEDTNAAYAPFTELIQVTPSDVTVYAPALRGCIIETSGAIAVNTEKGDSSVVITVAAGQLIPAMITQVLATGTTATMVCGR